MDEFKQVLTELKHDHAVDVSRRWGQGLVLTAVFSLICAVFIIPVTSIICAALMTGIVFAIVRFRRDNAELLEGASKERLASSAKKACFYFTPCLLVLLPGFLLAFAVDYALEIGVSRLEKLAAAEEIIVTEVSLVDREWYDPWSWAGYKKEVTTQKTDLMKKGLPIRATVGALRNLLVILGWYGWLFVGFVTLRTYFYFWSRAFIGDGGQVVMKLRRHA